MNTTEAKDIRDLFGSGGSEAVQNKLKTATTYRPPLQSVAPVHVVESDAITTPMRGLPYFDQSDAGNADRFHAVHGQNVRHVTESGQWLVWNGSRWEPDHSGEVIRRFIATMRETAKQATQLENADFAGKVAKFALKSTNRAQVEAGIALAKSIAGVSVSVNDLDADLWMIGTANGATIDLGNGIAITPRREHLITKSIGCDHDPSADCPIWERFIKTVTDDDNELAEFLQAAIGYTLTASVREQCLFFLFGTGQNGKGVFSETVKRLLCDYGQTAPETLFTKDKNSSATNDIARLAGCRMAIASELDEGAAFAESRIKSLTGGDTITARFLHKEFFDFPPSHKFWISGNHKPTVRGTDHGIWRRLRLVPFTVTIPEHDKDPDLVNKLAVEMPGILNWAIAGCLQWQREGLQVPRCVKQATDEYRREEDVIGQFLDECTERTKGERTLITDLYRAYEQWAEREGIRFKDTARRFNRKIEEHGQQRGKSGGARFWENLALVSIHE